MKKKEKGFEMNITINPISNCNYKPIKNNKRNETPTPQETKEALGIYYNDLNFKGRYSTILVKPTFENPKLQMLSNKLTSYIKNFPPNAKMSKPVLMPTKDGVIGFVIEKSRNLTNFEIKEVKNISKIDNWEKIDLPYEGLNVVFDHKGQVISANSYKSSGMNILYERTHNARRIRYGNYFYLPIVNEEYVWKRMKEVPGMKPFYSAAEKMEFNETDLQVFFSEIIRKRASLLASF